MNAMCANKIFGCIEKPKKDDTKRRNNLSKGFDERANVEEDFDDFRYLFGKILVVR